MVLGLFQALFTDLIFPNPFRNYYYPPFIDEKTEAQRLYNLSKVIQQKVAGLGLHPSFMDQSSSSYSLLVPIRFMKPLNPYWMLAGSPASWDSSTQTLPSTASRVQMYLIQFLSGRKVHF